MFGTLHTLLYWWRRPLDSCFPFFSPARRTTRTRNFTIIIIIKSFNNSPWPIDMGIGKVAENMIFGYPLIRNNTHVTAFQKKNKKDKTKQQRHDRIADYPACPPIPYPYLRPTMQSFSANHSKMWSNRNADQFLAFRIGQTLCYPSSQE